MSNPRHTGGANPAIRTLFYRLVRLLGLAIHPIFVFDGPKKPAFKRNKRSGRADGVATAMAKRLIRLFGFAYHEAPGEAEAECALLEQQGVVDAVLSEDVDTIMFGCRRTLRNWSAEGTKGSKSPTHVSLYDAAAVAAGKSGLDREGMVLVALMSGGDYLPEGVPGCGIKVACEAARAGFGRDLCRIKRADRDALAAWKERLLHELRTNESRFFRTKHKALEIPESFPNMEVLRYYTHPVVSQQATIDRLKKEFPAASAVDVVGLREFARETFDWTFRVGAVKLIRVLAPSLLVQRFLDRYVSGESHHDDLDLQQKEESALVKAISSRRVHFSTDATPELRMSFIPADIVKLDLDAEPEEEMEAFGRTGLALNSDDELDEEAAEELDEEQPKSGSSRKPFDPFQPELVWIPETVAKLGVPLTVEDWEGKQRMKEQKIAARGARKTRAKKTDMPAGALDKYVKVTKNVADCSTAKGPVESIGSGSPPQNIINECSLPAPRARSKQPKKPSTTTQTGRPSKDVNPWSLASSQVSPRVASSTSHSLPHAPPIPSSAQEPILISSSPVAASPPPALGEDMTSSPTTPTRPKRLQSPPVDDCPSPEPSLDLPQATRKAPEEEVSAGAQSTRPTRRARPFKRVKSQSDENPKPTTAQKSIKDYGRVLKSMAPSRVNAKAIPSPIELLSDDDDDDCPLPTFKPPPGSPFAGDDPPNPGSGDPDDEEEEEDPFGPPSPARHRTASRSTSQPASEAPKPQQDDDLCQRAKGSRDDRPAGDAPARESTTATAKATTTVYIARPSLGAGGDGYFDEVEVSRDEADSVLAAYESSGPRAGSGAQRDRGQGGRRRRAWRLSEIEVLDLTGED